MSVQKPARDPDPEQGFRAEHYFPMGYLTAPFRRRPYAGMTYGEAMEAAMAELWNIAHPAGQELSDKGAAMVRSAQITHDKLRELAEKFHLRNIEHPTRSQALVHEFSNLWHGPVTVVLEWFRKTEGA